MNEKNNSNSNSKQRKREIVIRMKKEIIIEKFTSSHFKPVRFAM